MTREEFARPYIVALYKTHRTHGGHIPSVSELTHNFELPRDQYFERQLSETLEALGWAQAFVSSGEATTDYGLAITHTGKITAESLMDEGFIVDAARLDHQQIPAADRIVSLSDNDPKVIEARQRLQELEHRLILGNDVGGLSKDELVIARAEVSVLQTFFRAARTRAEPIMEFATRSLKWISEKATSAAIGELAKVALKAVAGALGYPIN